jgi:hypothetical protein
MVQNNYVTTENDTEGLGVIALHAPGGFRLISAGIWPISTEGYTFVGQRLLQNQLGNGNYPTGLVDGVFLYFKVEESGQTLVAQAICEEVYELEEVIDVSEPPAS